MAEIVNLRRAKKQRVRAEAARQAAENRVRHGQTREALEAVRRERAGQARVLDGAALDRSGVGDGEAGE